MTTKDTADAKLLDKIEAAAKVYNATEKTVVAAQADHVSRAKALGLLLLEAKKLHPAVKDFDAFLKKAKGLQYSRAADLMRIAGGKVTEAELKKDAAERKQKSRAKKKLAKPTTKPETKPDASVTDPNVTETAEASAEKRKAENAAAVDDADFVDPTLATAPAATDQSKMAKASDLMLREFKIACDIRLPKMAASDIALAAIYFEAKVAALTGAQQKAA